MNKQTTLFIALMFYAPLFAMDESHSNQIEIKVPSGENQTRSEWLDPAQDDAIELRPFSELIAEQHKRGKSYTLGRVESEDSEQSHYVDGNSVRQWVTPRNYQLRNGMIYRPHSRALTSCNNPLSNTSIRRLSYFTIAPGRQEAVYDHDHPAVTDAPPPPLWPASFPWDSSDVMPLYSSEMEGNDGTYSCCGICTTTKPLPECSRRNAGLYACLCVLTNYALCLDSTHITCDFLCYPCSKEKNCCLITRKLICENALHMETCCGCDITTDTRD